MGSTTGVSNRFRQHLQNMARWNIKSRYLYPQIYSYINWYDQNVTYRNNCFKTYVSLDQIIKWEMILFKIHISQYFYLGKFCCENYKYNLHLLVFSQSNIWYKYGIFRSILLINNPTHAHKMLKFKLTIVLIFFLIFA